MAVLNKLSDNWDSFSFKKFSHGTKDWIENLGVESWVTTSPSTICGFVKLRPSSAEHCVIIVKVQSHYIYPLWTFALFPLISIENHTMNKFQCAFPVAVKFPFGFGRLACQISPFFNFDHEHECEVCVCVITFFNSFMKLLGLGLALDSAYVMWSQPCVSALYWSLPTPEKHICPLNC